MPNGKRDWRDIMIAALLAIVLSSGGWWFVVGNKLTACDKVVELQLELKKYTDAVHRNTDALNRMNLVLTAHGITLDNLSPRREEDDP